MAQALDTRKRILPTHFDRLRSRSDRGLGVVLPFIDLGSVVSACEELPGFHRLLPRLELFDGSAVSEARYAAALVRAGYSPELEPQVGTGLVDAAIDWEGGRIYAEVIAPERAEVIVAAHSDVQALAGALCGAISGTVVEVLLHSDIGPDTLPRILASLPDLPSGVPRTLEGFATIVQQPGAVPLILIPFPGRDAINQTNFQLIYDPLVLRTSPLLRGIIMVQFLDASCIYPPSRRGVSLKATGGSFSCKRSIYCISNRKWYESFASLLGHGPGLGRCRRAGRGHTGNRWRHPNATS